MSSPRLILASQSESRRRMLAAAGIPHEAMRSPCDEEAAKARFREAGLGGEELALALAEAKAAAVDLLPSLRAQRGNPVSGTDGLPRCARNDEHLILGCDQILVAHDGSQLDKAESLDHLAEQLAFLSGQTHRLISAAVILSDGQRLWSAAQSAHLTMRPLSPDFIAEYLAHEGDTLLGCVGGYRIEGLGAQLFSAVEGNSFVVQGLPMFPLLDVLRARGVIAS
jgi:septum formation protein